MSWLVVTWLPADGSSLVLVLSYDPPRRASRVAPSNLRPAAFAGDQIDRFVAAIETLPGGEPR